jgi:hypothetical protein
MPDGGGQQRPQQMTFQNQSQNQNSSGLTGPSPVIAPKLESILTGFWDRYGTGAAPTYYPGQSFVPMSSDTQAAFSALANRRSDLSTINAAGDSLRDTLGGKFLDMGNPYLDARFQAAFARQNKQFTDEIAPALDAKFVGAGRTGSFSPDGSGNLHVGTTMRLARDLGQTQGDAIAQAVAGEWGNERNRMLQAAGLAPSIDTGRAGLELQDIMGKLQAGKGQEEYTGREIADNFARYNYGQTSQPEWYARMAQLIQSIYPGGSTSGSSSSSGSGSSMGYASGGGGGVGDFLGAGMGLAGLGLKAASLFSDERAKTDIEPLGIDPLTGLPMFAYRYKNDPKEYPKVVGPMAQDIEAVAPHLVREIGGNKIIHAGGLM